MFIYDSQKKQKVLFEPIKQGEVSIYVCGPTVYDDAHLGHARSAIAFDLLRRVLMANSLHVTFVKNFTDIDDKIINKMKESGKSLEEITSFYINRYKEDMHALYIDDADIEPKATESLNAIIGFVEKLLENKNAYQTSSGVYFDTSKDDKYLSLSHRNIDESDLRARVEGDLEKKNPKDFALWKLQKDDELFYPSPFGNGRPGWHIECSAMIKEHLAHKSGDFQIDIHAGGADLLFPHHENEAAQTRKCSNQEIAKYWMHNGFVTINGEKMSKSLGNSFFLKDVLKAYHGEIIRYYLLSTHYRSNIDFNELDLLSSKKRLDKIYRLKKRLEGILVLHVDEKFKDELLGALDDDLNISVGLAVIDEMINSANDLLDKNPKDKAFKGITLANLNFVQEVLGVGNLSAKEYFQLGIDEEFKKEIEELIIQRNTAKKEKNYKKADEIRDYLLNKNIQLLDTPNGVEWEKVDR
ncbi:MAG: cysteine--tRNA ligase [Campylobacteraceae bacterium]